MFSTRVPNDLGPNSLTRAIHAARARGARLIDLTETNPTRVGLEYPPGLLEPLAEPAGLVYRPQPFGLPDAREAIAAECRTSGLPVEAERLATAAAALNPADREAAALLAQLRGLRQRAPSLR